MSLGLDTLTDDQLVEMARAVATELTRRNPAVVDAAQAAIRDEIARAAKSQDNIWAVKKWLAAMVDAHLGRGCSISVWGSGDVTRVYIDAPGGDKRGRDSVKCCYHVTGSSKVPPGSVTIEAGSRAEISPDETIVAIIGRHAIASFKPGTRIECNTAMSTDYVTPPMPADYAARKAALDAAAARAKYRSAKSAELFQPVRDFERAEIERRGLKYSFELPEDVRAAATDMTKKAGAALDEAMVAYDAQHGSA